MNKLIIAALLVFPLTVSISLACNPPADITDCALSGV